MSFSYPLFAIFLPRLGFGECLARAQLVHVLVIARHRDRHTASKTPIGQFRGHVRQELVGFDVCLIFLVVRRWNGTVHGTVQSTHDCLENTSRLDPFSRCMHEWGAAYL